MMGEVRGQKLNFGQRADFRNLSPNDKIFGEDNVIYNVERNVILKEKERLQEGDSPLSFGDFCRNLRKYLEQDRFITENLERGYEKYGRNLEIEFSKLNPKKWLFLLILGIVMETSILVIQSAFSGGFNPVIILFAFLLATGGVMFGHSLGSFFFISELRRKGQSSAEEESGMIRDIFVAVIGVILILFVAWFRGVSDEGIDMEVVLLTVVLGSMVATLEGIRENTERKKKDILIYRRYELLKIATRKHCDSLAVYLEGIRENCKDYISDMEDICKKSK